MAILFPFLCLCSSGIFMIALYTNRLDNLEAKNKPDDFEETDLTMRVPFDDNYIDDWAYYKIPSSRGQTNDSNQNSRNRKSSSWAYEKVYEFGDFDEDFMDFDECIGSYRGQKTDSTDSNELPSNDVKFSSEVNDSIEKMQVLLETLIQKKQHLSVEQNHHYQTIKNDYELLLVSYNEVEEVMRESMESMLLEGLSKLTLSLEGIQRELAVMSTQKMKKRLEVIRTRSYD